MCGLRVEDFDSMPDVADDLFLLAAKCLSHAPHLVLTPQNLPALVDCAMAGVLVQHKEACTSVLEFLEQICKACAKHPQVGLPHSLIIRRTFKPAITPASFVA
jgi:transportin-3